MFTERDILSGLAAERKRSARERTGTARPLGAARMVSSTLAAMRVEVNTELCQGHNRCYALAPELFDVDDYGTAMVIGDGTVPAELEEKARLAAANCPEYAISVTDD